GRRDPPADPPPTRRTRRGPGVAARRPRQDGVAPAVRPPHRSSSGSVPPSLIHGVTVPPASARLLEAVRGVRRLRPSGRR
ncbi:hypothetical protein NGM37_49715, partial [Streptomyces sp. TRM76130]|nr:hypothetical protein [Streptomyces sp. TRM76130]